MKILIYGAGSLGSLVGGLLAREHLVALVARPPHVEAIKQNGLEITGLREEKHEVLAMENLSELYWEPDLVLLTVKSYDTANACRELAALEPVPVVSLQNGLGNLEIIRKTLWGPETVYGCTTSMGALLESPGSVRYTGKGKTVLQKPRMEDDFVLSSLKETFQREGMEIAFTEDIQNSLWEKAAVNLGINYLTALSGKKNGFLADHWDHYSEFMGGLMTELVQIAGGSGVRMDKEKCVAYVKEVAERTRGNTSSMLQDVKKGRRTENEALAGYLLDIAGKNGRNSPRIQTLYSLMNLLEGRG